MTTSSGDTGFLRRRPVRRAWRLWRERHQHPVNFALHMVGIPLALLLAPILLFVLPWSAWYWAALAFVAGYLLQWIGHRIEGNDVGEFIPIKRLLGLRVTPIAQRYAVRATPAERAVP